MPQLRAYVRWRELLESTDRPPFAAYARLPARAARLAEPRARCRPAPRRRSTTRSPSTQRLAFFAGRAAADPPGAAALYAEALLAGGRRDEAAALAAPELGRGRFRPGPRRRAFLARFGDDLRAARPRGPARSAAVGRRADQARRMLARGRRRRRARWRRHGSSCSSATRRSRRRSPRCRRSARRDPGLLYDRLRWRRRKRGDDGRRARDPARPAGRARPARQVVGRAAARDPRRRSTSGSYELAYRLAAAHGRSTGTGFAEAEWLAGWLALRFSGKPEAARRHFERLWRSRGDADQPGARRLLGRPRRGGAGRRAGRGRWYQRAAAYPTTFYGQLAADELGLALPRPVGPAADGHAARARGAASGARRRALARLLCALGRARRAPSRSSAISATRRPTMPTAAAGGGRPRASAAAAPTSSWRPTRAAAGNGADLVRDAFPLPRDREPSARPRQGRPEPALRAGRGAAGEPVRSRRAQPGRRHGPDAADAGTAQVVARELGLPVRARAG